MKTLIRIAFTALSLSFGIAHAAVTNSHSPAQQGLNYMEGGGG